MNGGAQNQAPGGAPTVPEHELVHPIASGAYGQVWLARNTLGIFRAVKIVYRSSFDHDRPFEREFAGIKAFEPVSRAHQGLVDLLQVGRDDSAGYFYYVMELADATQDLTGEAGSNGEDRTESNRSESMQLKHLRRFARRDRNLEGYAPRTLASELKGRGA